MMVFFFYLMIVTSSQEGIFLIQFSSRTDTKRYGLIV